MLIDPHEKDDDVCTGVIILIVAHVVAYFLFFFLHPLVFDIFKISYIPYFVFYPIPYWFLIQFIYVIPLCLIYKRRGYDAIVKGIIIGAVVTLLINGSCFFLLMRG
jgi:hypothetical protein